MFWIIKLLGNETFLLSILDSNPGFKGFSFTSSPILKLFSPIHLAPTTETKTTYDVRKVQQRVIQISWWEKKHLPIFYCS